MQVVDFPKCATPPNYIGAGMKRRNFAHLNNGLAAALDVVGEWWTPLIVRAVFKGHVRFEAIQSELGVARNILTDRLHTLVESNVLHRVQYNDKPVRHEYHLTDKGVDLYGTLIALKAWGDKWMLNDNPTPKVIHSACNSVLRPRVVCADCGDDVQFIDTHVASDEL